MDRMDIGVLFAGVPVTDFDAAVRWYARLLGRSADVIVKDDEVMWRFADAAWLYVLSDQDRAGHALVTLSVTNLDKTIADIAARGITGGPTEFVGNAGRKALFTDADGNSLAFIEVAAAADSDRGPSA
jgi:predicted enzyme related to lactoylglutathione lyase